MLFSANLPEEWSCIFRRQLLLLSFLLFENGLCQPLGMQPYYHHVHCAKCPAGFGVIAVCNLTHPNTLCSPCEERSSYSAADEHLDSCQPCTHCGQGLFIHSQCTSTSNTVCRSCHQEDQVFYSWEYYRRCLLHLPPHEKHPTPSSRAASLLHLNSFLSDAQRRPLNLHSQDDPFVLYSLVLAENRLPKQNSPPEAQDTADIHDTLISSTTDPAGNLLIDNTSTKYQKYPDTVLALVLLTTFFVLGCASFFAVILLVYLKRSCIIKAAYGGVKVDKDGSARLLSNVETSDNPYDDEEAIV